MPIGLDDTLGRPVAEAEAVRHDASAGAQLREQLRHQSPVHIGKEKQGHHRSLAQIGEEQVLLSKLYEALHPGFECVAARTLDHAPVELDADAARTVAARSGNGDTAIAGTKVVDDVGSRYARKPKHCCDHGVRGWEVQHLGFMHFGSVGLRDAARRSACRVCIPRGRGAGEEQCRNDEENPACHDSVLDPCTLEHRTGLTKINMGRVLRTRLQTMNAGDIMVKDVVAVGPEAPVREVAMLMLERRISGLPVVDGERRVLGIVSEGDLIRRPEIETDHTPKGWLGLFLSDQERARDFVKSHGRKAREVMTQPAICVAPDTPLTEVVRLMERHRVKRLLVAEDGRLAGVVTHADLLRAMVAHRDASPAAASDRDLRDQIDRMLRGEDWANSAYVNVQVENGVAHLWGTVESASQREALILAVRGVPGVKEVQPHFGRSMPG